MRNWVKKLIFSTSLGFLSGMLVISNTSALTNQTTSENKTQFLQDQLKTLEQQLQVLQEEEEKLLKEREEILKTLEQQGIALTPEDREKLEQTLQEINDKLAELQEEKTVLDAEITSLQKEIEQVEAIIQKTDSVINSLQNYANQLENLIKDLENTANSLVADTDSNVNYDLDLIKLKIQYLAYQLNKINDLKENLIKKENEFLTNLENGKPIYEVDLEVFTDFTQRKEQTIADFTKRMLKIFEDLANIPKKYEELKENIIKVYQSAISQLNDPRQIENLLNQEKQILENLEKQEEEEIKTYLEALENLKTAEEKVLKDYDDAIEDILDTYKKARDQIVSHIENTILGGEKQSVSDIETSYDEARKELLNTMSDLRNQVTTVANDITLTYLKNAKQIEDHITRLWQDRLNEITNEAKSALEDAFKRMENFHAFEKKYLSEACGIKGHHHHHQGQGNHYHHHHQGPNTTSCPIDQIKQYRQQIESKYREVLSFIETYKQQIQNQCETQKQNFESTIKNDLDAISQIEKAFLDRIQTTAQDYKNQLQNIINELNSSNMDEIKNKISDILSKIDKDYKKDLQKLQEENLNPELQKYLEEHYEFWKETFKDLENKITSENINALKQELETKLSQIDKDVENIKNKAEEFFGNLKTFFEDELSRLETRCQEFQNQYLNLLNTAEANLKELMIDAYPIDSYSYNQELLALQAIENYIRDVTNRWMDTYSNEILREYNKLVDLANGYTNDIENNYQNLNKAYINTANQYQTYLTQKNSEEINTLESTYEGYTSALRTDIYYKVNNVPLFTLATPQSIRNTFDSLIAEAENISSEIKEDIDQSLQDLVSIKKTYKDKYQQLQTELENKQKEEENLEQELQQTQNIYNQLNNLITINNNISQIQQQESQIQQQINQIRSSLKGNIVLWIEY